MEDWETCDLYDFVGSWECTMSEREKKLYRIENLCPEHEREREMEKFKEEFGTEDLSTFDQFNMIIRIEDDNVRNDISIYVSVSGVDKDKLEITIDQQVPPCGDMKQVSYHILDLPSETNPKDFL